MKADIDEGAWTKDGMTEKQRRFVHFYMGEAGGVASRAASLAGYRDDNNNSLRATASYLLTCPNVQRALERERGRQFGSEEDVKNGIAAIANSNASEYLEQGEDGKYRVNLEKMAACGALGMIQSIQEERIEVPGTSIMTVKLKVKTYDKLAALAMLAKMNGQMVERVKSESTLIVRGEAEEVAKVLNDPDARRIAAQLAERMACLPGNVGKQTDAGQIHPPSAPANIGA